MEQLLKEQKEVIDQIKTINTNYHKDSITRKTDIYLHAKLEKIRILWKKFKDIDDKLLEFHEDNKNHPYWPQRDEINKIYSELKNDIENKLEVNKINNKIAMKEKMFNYKILEFNNLVEKLDVTNKSKISLQQNIVFFKEQWNAITNLRDELLEKTAEIDFENKMKTFSDLTKKYLDTIIKLETECNKFESKSEVSGINMNAKKNDCESKIKLPQIEIPKFNGDYKKWQEFNDIYTQIVHENKSITDIQKFQYLKGCVQGEAARPISHLAMTIENYNTAWEILKNRYENKRLIVSKLIEDIMCQPKVSQNNFRAIKELHDRTNECLFGLKNCGINTDNWDPILIFILSAKLDKESINIYEQSRENPKELQKLNEFLIFLEKRYQTLEGIASRFHPEKSETQDNKKQSKCYLQGFSSKNSNKANCLMCNEEHLLSKCSKFALMSRANKLNVIKTKKLCMNCFSPNHSVTKCKSKFSCFKCKKRHHTMLHLEVEEKTSSNEEGPRPGMSTDSSITSMSCNLETEEVLLATALVKVTNKSNKELILRALIDQGSMASFVSERAAKLINCKRSHTNVSIKGIGAADAGVTRNKMQFTIQAIDAFININAFILPKLADNIPENNIENLDNKEWGDIVLADPQYYKSNPIDVIIGVDVYGQIIEDGLIKGEKGLVAQRTQLGWIVFGQTYSNKKLLEIKAMVTNIQLNETFKAFFEQEEIEKEREKTVDDRYCEKLYEENVRRERDGRYIVPLIFKKEQPKLGKSRELAMARFMQLEKKLGKNPKFEIEYKNCIREYFQLGHIKPCSNNERLSTNYFYLPHHAVIKDSSSTTKLRVVFDGSAKTSTGVSLNDIFLSGPVLQQSLFNIIVRWRKHEVVLTADIEKMYRQIKVRECDQNFQRILWREGKTEPVKDFKLTTVTFGTACAPYLAIKTIQQLAQDNINKFPSTAKIILRDFYVDDLLTGCDTVEHAVQLKLELTKLLESGGFPLRKWNSNSQTVVGKMHDASEVTLSINNTISMLGIVWNPMLDILKIKTDFTINSKSNTKRSLLSNMCKIFDPLGWLAPCTVKSKLLMQEIWSKGIGWDENVPQNICDAWNKIKSDFDTINQFSIPRWIGYRNKCNITIHGFADASEKAFAAVVYSKIIMANGDIETVLLASKSKVASLKKKSSLPRLELCGAVLLARLINKIKEALEIKNLEIHAWTDSEIVLAWLSGDVNKWKTFVANRVSEIRDLIPNAIWRHIKSKENPADSASRGMYPSELSNNDLWWRGPSCLRDLEFGNTMLYREHFTTNVEEKANKLGINKDSKTERIQVNVAVCRNFIDSLLEKYSSWNHILIILSFSFRFIQNARTQKSERLTGGLTRDELNNANQYIVKRIQQDIFFKEIDSLIKFRTMSGKSQLRSLNPFLDDKGILRVGGRLTNSNAPYSTKYPIILPKGHRLTVLIIKNIHITYLHPGISSMIAITRQKYWIPGCKDMIKTIIHRCAVCYRHKQQSSIQLMGQLPMPRVTPNRAFMHTGVDYAGPVLLKTAKGRGGKIYKGYIVVLVCLSTKAIHLEIAGDLTSESCIAALNRFIARRGLPSDLYSDNGTNFIGAKRQLGELEQLVRDQTFNNNIAHSLLSKRINWHMIPPSAPNFGGLWEAAVKSMKHHLKRVIGESILTLEEFYTLLTQIEAILNSRPLSVLSSDHLDPLTPGHFLIGAPLTQVPEPSLENVVMNRLSRWQLIQQMTQGFWKRWTQEYLTTLQQRPKHWQTKQENMKINDIVIIKENNIPPTKWLLGRVVELHPGKDKTVRVVTVKTKNGMLKRPVTKLATIPTEKDEVVTSKRSDEETNNSSGTVCNLGTINRHERLRSTHTPLKPSISSISWLFILLISIIINYPKVKATSEDMSLIKFDHQPGIYFEGLSHVSMVETYWRILAFVDLQNYEESLVSSQRCINILNDTLSIKMDVQHQTNGTVLMQRNMLNMLKHQLKIIEENDNILRQKSNRRKRGLINVIGNVANELFGVLDQRDAVHYEAEFKKLKDNEEYMHKLIKNQTSISSLTINSMIKEEVIIRNKIEEITSHFNKIQDHINDLAKLQYTTTVFEYCSAITNNIERIQNRLINILLNAHQGGVHPNIFNPHQLKRELEKIRQSLEKGTFIPGETENSNIINTYKTMTARAGISKNNIIIEIKIPLITNEIYQLFHLVPVPTFHSNKFWYIKPQAQYLATTLTREHFTFMTEKDFGKCYEYQNNHILCHNQNPVFTTLATANQCEMELLRHKKEFPEVCDIRSVNVDRIWTPLKEKGSWIYAVNGSRTIDLICNKRVQTIQLKDNGIIRLFNQCKIQDAEITIKAEPTVKTSLNISYLPSQNLHAIIHTHEYRLRSPTVRPIKFEYNNDLNKLKELIDNQKTAENMITTGDNSYNSHDLYHYIVLCIIIIIIIGICVYGHIVKRNIMSTLKQTPLSKESKNVSPTPLETA